MSSMGTKVRSSSERAARARAARSSLAGRQALHARVASWPAEWREAFEERAAIVEFCGGLGRVDAEAMAAELVQVEFGRCTARGPPARP